MPHFGLLCPPASGHLFPLCTLGRELKSRGHRVTAFQLPELQSRIEAAGLEFSRLAPSSQGELAASIEQLGKLSGMEGIRFTVQCAVRLAELVFQYAPDALRNAGIDLAIVDQNEPAGASVAEHLGIPFVSVAHLPLNREPAIPPPFMPWPFADNPAARLRNRIGYQVADIFTAPLTKVLNHWRNIWNLSPLRIPDDSFSGIAQICTLPRSLDFPRQSLASNFHYTGPFIDNHREPVTFPWGALDGRTLIYASFGTMLNGNEKAFETIAAACENLPVQLVMSLGGAQYGERKWPANALVIQFAPQLEILKRARLFITHAGLNSVLESLQAGVPMVALPVTNDQPAVAARLKHSGAGEVIPFEQLSAEKLRARVKTMLFHDRYSRSCRSLQAEILAAGGVRRAAEIVERCVAGTVARSLSATV